MDHGHEQSSERRATTIRMEGRIVRFISQFQQRYVVIRQPALA